MGNNLVVDYSLAVVSVVVICGFIPLSAYSFINYRLDKKQRQYSRMLRHLGYTGKDKPAYLPRLDEEYRWQDYIAPVLFASIITLLGAITMVFGGEILRLDGLIDQSTEAKVRFVSLLLEGPHMVLEQDVNPIVVGTHMLGLAFAGAYLWSFQNLFRRLSTLDLPPGVYYSIGQRIIFSMFVALLLFYVFIPPSLESEITTNQYTAIAIAAFAAGMFPQRIIDRLKDKIDEYMSPVKNKADQLQLNMIEGIQAFEKLRLGEVGIDNAQNLAKAYFLELVIRTPFNPREVIDWIGQARLYLFFKSDIEKLRSAGVRTIFDFKTIVCAKNSSDPLAKQSGIPIERIQLVAEVVKNDADIDHLEKAIAKLVGFELHSDLEKDVVV